MNSILRSLASGLILLLLMISSAWAEETYELDIADQELSSALKVFAEQSGLQVVYFADLAAGKQAKGVRGTYSADSALVELLDDTDLTYSTVDDRTYAIAAQATAGDEGGDSDSGNARRAPILMAQNQAAVNAQDVSERTGAAKGQETVHEIPEITVFGRGVKSTLQEVPQSTILYDRAFLENTAAGEIRDVVRFIPSGATNRHHNGSSTQIFNSRGFAASYVTNSVSPLNAAPLRDPAGLERVEVLQGPASVLYGAMEPGAVINLVTKKPLATPHFSLGLRFGTYNNHRYTVDTGKPFGSRVRVRLNAVYESRETFYDFWERDRIDIAPVVEIDLTDHTLLTLEASYRKFEDANGIDDGRYPAVGTVLPNPNGQIPKEFSHVQPGLGDWEESVQEYSASLAHDLNDNWNMSVYVARAREEDGGLFWFAPSFQSDLRTLNRLLFAFEPIPGYSTFSAVNVSGQVGTGPLTHKLIIGLDYLDEETKTVRGIGALPGMDVFNPVRGQTIVVPPFDFQSVLTTTASGVFIQDRIAIGEKFTALVGVRWSEIESLSASAAYPGPLPELTGIKQDEVSTQFGLVYDATDSVALYASRTTSFVPRGGSTFGGEPFDPERGLQYEVGAKARIFRGLSGTVAVFHAEKPNVVVGDPVNVGAFLPIGEVQSEGIELTVSGRPAENLFMHASYAYLDTESVEGFGLPTAPENTLGIFARYDLSAAMRGFSLSGSLQYRDDVLVGALTNPAITRFDFGVHYALDEQTEFSINVENAFNEQIWNAFHQGTWSRGLDRTITAGIQFRM